MQQPTPMPDLLIPSLLHQRSPQARNLRIPERRLRLVDPEQRLGLPQMRLIKHPALQL